MTNNLSHLDSSNLKKLTEDQEIKKRIQAIKYAYQRQTTMLWVNYE
jgi:glycerol kinase